ncbi:hypothetical protein LTR17_011790 [Elasticomyces elasticus]|nr:hypothetical protein LTR17_011790 [Elasticomyces elasticus]
MQLATILLPVLLAALGAEAKSNRDICTDKNPSATNAIGKFCQKTDMVIPSDWAKWGMSGYNGKTIVRIKGNCNPYQWVPQQYCMSQFFEMCAQGGKHGAKKRNFGNNGCQKWEIVYQKDLIAGNKRGEEGVGGEEAGFEEAGEDGDEEEEEEL